MQPRTTQPAGSGAPGAPGTPPGQDDRSLGDLFSELTHEMRTLIQQEIQLASAELSGKASTAARNVGFLAAGAALIYAGFLAVVAAVVLGLAHLLPWWLAALVVGLVVALAGYLLLQKGIGALKRLDPAPRQTIDTLKEDAAWAKRQAA